MLPRERVLAALERKPVDRVPYLETTIGVKIGEQLLDRRTPLVFIREYGRRVCVLGNVDVTILSDGTPEETYSEVRDLIRDLGPNYGYMVSSGNSAPDYVRAENMLALARAMEDFGSYRS